MLAAVLFALLAATEEPAAPVDVDVDDAGHWTFAGVPRLTLNSDEGVGLGVRGIFFWHRFGTRPYKTAITFQAWATTRLVQHHYVKVDAVDAFNVPLRLEAELGFFSTLTLPYCGNPPASTCVDDDSTRLRSLEPYGSATSRFRVWKQPWFKDTLKLEAFVGWRGTGYIPGTLFDDDGDGAPDLFPYPGSRYAIDHPRGEPGFASVLQLGVALDTRDDEPNPSRGFFVDASVRDSQPAWGSSFAFVGANLTARLYAPVLPGVVVAERVVVDGVVGDAPWRERTRFGGLVETNGIGGQDIGRGIRLARYPGRLRLSLQHEVRVTSLVLDVGGNSLALPVAFFVDSGVAFFDKQGLDDARLLFGGGISFRLIWNRTFVMRLDLALSPEEPGRLSAYSSPGQPW
ncbi:MAG: BamA/TamA family outer membrane protein [Deltaproteobacteria bacterium]|nr:BamA/TamA family outer membrane protein [Deltaproteobacteria bacterium]